MYTPMSTAALFTRDKIWKQWATYDITKPQV